MQDMAKYRRYDPKQSQFFVLQPEKLLAENHLLSTIDTFIEESVSLEVFSKKLRNDAGGAPGVDPRLLLKVLFYSYANGVFSSHEMEERMSWDVNYVYLCGGQIVDHSTICNFLLEYKEEIQDVFTQLLYVGNILGLLGMDFIAIDGTKIRANVDKEFTGTVKDFLEKKKHLEEKIAERMERTAEEDTKYRKRSERKIEQMRRTKAKIDEFVEKVGTKSGKIKSLSDPDASIVKDQDKKYPGYNCQAAVDDKHHMIVAVDVTNEENDVHMLEPMVKEIRRQTGNDLKEAELGVDSGYSSSESLRWVDQEGLSVFMPSGRGPGGQQKLPEDCITSRHCELKIQGDLRLLTCPGGQTMACTKSIITSRAENYTFEPDPAKCVGCSFKEVCYQNVRKSKKRFIVRKDYFENLPLRQQMTQRLSSLHGKHRMADRSCVVEHVFGELKELRSFRRFFHRGLKKTKLIWTILCTAYNFRKMALFKPA
jgi:transposase